MTSPELIGTAVLAFVICGVIDAALHAVAANSP